jgi:TM2 domain-containing membrane protein YozV
MTSLKNKYIAAILAVFFGAFGAHKFYLDKFVSGLIRLVLFTFFFLWGYSFGREVLFMIGFVEGLILLLMSHDSFNEHYNQNIDVSNRPWGKVTVTPKVKNNPYLKTGNEKYKEFDYTGAIEDYTKGLVINPHDNVLHFNLACAYSLTEDSDKSFYHLNKAVEFGYKDLENIKTKDDLSFIRVQPEFENFVKNNFSTNNPNQTKEGGIEENSEELPDLLGQIKILNQKREKGELSDDDYFEERKKLLG